MQESTDSTDALDNELSQVFYVSVYNMHHSVESNMKSEAVSQRPWEKNPMTAWFIGPINHITTVNIPAF